MTQRLFRHYNGTIYRLIGEATHTEVPQRLIIYQSTDPKDPPFWYARPASQFFGKVTRKDGTKVPRFVEIQDDQGVNA